MDYNDTLKWLKSYRILHDKLIYINNRIERVQAINYEPSASGPGKSINELIDNKTEVIKQMEEIEDAIDNVKDETLSMVLGYRFLFCYTIKETADKMGYSTRRINDLTKKAVKECTANHCIALDNDIL